MQLRKPSSTSSSGTPYTSNLSNTYEKMDVRSRGEATRKALYEEWITLQDVTDDL
jgi:hypothetical protein